MSTEAISAIAAAPNAPLPAEEAESNWLALGQLHGRRRNTRTVLNRYLRSVKVLSEKLGKAVKESSDEQQKVAVKSAHSLLRQFYYTFNYITNQARDAPRYAVPSEFEAEIKEVLTDSNFAKFEAAAKATKEEYEKELPMNISSEVAERLLKFLSIKESDHIKAKYNSVIDELTTQIDARKTLPKEKKPKQTRRPRKDSKGSDASSGKAKKEKKAAKKPAAASIEEQLQAILKEVSKRSSAVRFSKDDFESYSEAQHQLDALHEETVSAIQNMKKSLRKRFMNAQKRVARPKKEEKK